MSSLVLRWFFLIFFAHGLVNALYVPSLVRWPAAFWIGDLFAFVVAPSAMVWLAIRRGEVRLADLGLRAPIEGGYGWMVFGLMILAAPIVSIVVHALDTSIALRIFPGSRALVEAPWSAVLPSPGPWRALAIIYLSVSAGFVEELIFRAVLFRIVMPRVAHSWRYVALSAVLFGLVHWEQGPASIVASALFGTFMAVLYRLSGNLWLPVVGHTTVDLVWFSRLARHI